MTNIKSSLHV